MFEDIFGAGLYNPALGNLLASNPEDIIPHLVAQGVPPPTMAFGPTGPNAPTPFERFPTDTSSPWLNVPQVTPEERFGPKPPLVDEVPSMTVGGPMAPPVSGIGSDALFPLTASPRAAAPILPPPTAVPTTPVPAAGPGMPLDIRPPVQKGETPAAAPQKKINALLDTLKGVQAPKAPEPQRISSPSPPRPGAMPADAKLISFLLNAMQGGSTAAPQLLALRQAIGGGRG